MPRQMKEHGRANRGETLVQVRVICTKTRLLALSISTLSLKILWYGACLGYEMGGGGRVQLRSRCDLFTPLSGACLLIFAWPPAMRSANQAQNSCLFYDLSYKVRHTEHIRVPPHTGLVLQGSSASVTKKNGEGNTSGSGFAIGLSRV